MKKNIILLLILLMSAVFTGCWDNIEINKRDYIFAIGIDKSEEGADGRFTFTAEIPKITKDGKNERKMINQQKERNGCI